MFACAPALLAASSAALASITIVNPGAESGTTGWTNVTGTLVSDTCLDPTEYPPHSGSYAFRLGDTATYEGYQDVTLPAALHSLIDAGSLLLRLTWWESYLNDSAADTGRIGVTFRDTGGATISTFPGSNAVGVTTGWRAQHTFVLFPANTRSIRLHMYGLRGLGIELNYYIDDIVAAAKVQTYSADLTITNPGAESGVTGWTNVTGTLVSGVFNGAGEPGPHSGLNCFRLGASSTYEGYQDVSVSSRATAIDSGNAAVALTWWQAGWASDSDSGAMAIAFLNGSNVEIGRQTAVQIDNDTWLQRNISAKIPAGTKTLRLIMLGTRVSAGTNLNAYIDDVSAKIIEYTP